MKKKKTSSSPGFNTEISWLQFPPQTTVTSNTISIHPIAFIEKKSQKQIFNERFMLLIAASEFYLANTV